MKKHHRNAGRYFRFVYLNPPKEKREQRVHETRDADACLELTPVLALQDLVYGGLLLNFPRNPVVVDSSFLGPRDLLIITTRPPLSDGHQKDRKIVLPSGTTLEKKIFEVLTKYFWICARSHIALQPSLASLLPEPYKDRADAKFRQHNSAGYTELKKWGDLVYQVNPDPKLTAAYFVYTRETWPGGPGLVVAHGMAGTQTLGFNHLVGTTELSRLLDSPVFAMVELKTPRVPHKPVDLSFTDEWRWDIILEVPLTPDTERMLAETKLPVKTDSSGADEACA